MPWSEERTRRVCSKIGQVFLVVAAVTVVAGLLSIIPLGGTGQRIAVAGLFYAVGGLAFRPSTWERVSYPFYPQRTPVIGILIVVYATWALFTTVTEGLA